MVLDPDGHRAEALQQTALGANRPPVVQEHLQRTPHRNPATDQEPLANNSAKTTIAKVAGDDVANRDGRREKCQGDGQTDPAAAKEFPKSPLGRDDPLTEVLVNRLSQGRSFVGSPRRAVKMHHQAPGLIHRQISRPVDDEFLGARVEIALAERRGIDRVEELSQFCDANLYDLAALRESVPRGRSRQRLHFSARR